MRVIVIHTLFNNLDFFYMLHNIVAENILYTFFTSARKHFHCRFFLLLLQGCHDCQIGGASEYAEARLTTDDDNNNKQQLFFTRILIFKVEKLFLI